MATGSIILTPGSALLPDGSASNLAPALSRVKSSAAAPTLYFLQLAFDASQTEQAMWQIRMPANYASGPLLKIQWKANATSNAVKWEARLAAYTPTTDTTSLNAKALAASNTTTTTVPATTAYRLVETSVTLTNDDTVAPGDFVVVYLARLGADAADTMAVDAEVVAVTFEYTTT